MMIKDVKADKGVKVGPPFLNGYWNNGMTKGQIIGANIGILLAIIIPVFLIILLVCH